MGSEHLKVLVTQQFPFPIAYYFRRAVEEKEPWEPSCHLLLSLLEFLGTVLACDYLSGEDRSPDVNQKLEKALLAVPGDGDWQGLIYRVLEFQAARSRPPFLRCLADLRDGNAEKEIQRLVKCRNDWVHRKTRFRIGSFRRDLLAVLHRIQPARRSALIFVHSSHLGRPLHSHEVTLFKGDNPNFAQIVCRSETALESGKMYLFGGESRQLLCLDPLMAYGRCDHCPEHHFFQYNKVDHRKVSYASLPGRHERRSGEVFLQIEHLVRSGAPPPLTPRHFTLPGDFSRIPRTLQPGDRLGPYRIEEVLKIAGLSQIYRAADSRSGASCALKVLPLELSRDPLLLRRFDEEARTLKNIDHPRVIKLRDLGEDFGDRYLVLDLAPGGKIESTLCRDLSEAAKPLREETIIDLAKQICDGLSHIHSLGIVHRDLKPGNLLLSGDQVLISDFGIVHSRSGDGVTQTGMPVGTPDYMAPEQILGEEVDHRADLYSLGCLLHELATGRPPFHTEMPLTTTLYHLQAAPAEITEINPRISRGLANIILKLIQKHPEQRYRSAGDLFRDLSHVGKDPAGPQVFQEEKMPEVRRAEIQSKLKRQYRFRLAATAVVLAVLVAIFVFAREGYWHWRVNSWIAQARSAWLAEPPGLPEALESLQRAFRRDREHGAVQTFLAEVALQGALTVKTQPDGLEMEAIPDERAAGQVGLNSARLVPGEGRLFRSGRRIRLGIGHWRIQIFRPGRVPWAQALVYIGQVRRSSSLEGDSGEFLTHQETRDFRPERQADSLSFVVGEEAVINPLVLPDPEWITEDLVFVNEGPFWRSAVPATIGNPTTKPYLDPQGKWRDMDVYDGSRQLIHDYLPRGFLISTEEITVGQFRRWFERFGPELYAWLEEGDSKITLLKASTRHVPMNVQKECWRMKLAERTIYVDSFTTHEKLLEVVFEEDLRYWRNLWSVENYRSLQDFLKTLNDDARPMISLGRKISAAYARTHSEIRPGEFVTWLKRKLADAAFACAGLRRARASVESASGESIDPLSLPPGRFVRGGSHREPEASWVPVLEGYATWLEARAFYAWQLPVERIIAWARADRGVQASALDARIDAIQDALSGPAWIGKLPGQDWSQGIKPNSEAQKLIEDYARAIREGRERPVRGHLLRWLAEVILEEDEAKESCEGLLASMSGGEKEARAQLDRLPFALRYQYGNDLGWDLPSASQWERASRGVDARSFPWGDQEDIYAAWVDRGKDAYPLRSIFARLRDVSPFGVNCLAGNVSEWVIVPGVEHEGTHFLKGGSCTTDRVYSNAGYFLGLQAGANTLWAGFRVVREIGSPPES